MGHKSGTKTHSGSQGALQHLERDLLDERIEDELAANEMSLVREMAQEHTDPAIQTLVDLHESEDTPPSVRRAAARDILEFGHGKPSQQIIQKGGGGNKFIVNVIRLGDGTEERVEKVVGEVRDDLQELLESEL
jgi:hypothetical protein